MRSHLRVLPREQLEESIRQLAAKYPKCFVANGRLRLPLKAGIEADLRQDGANENAIAAVGFYTQSWDYLQCLQAGAKRVDLDGIRVGTVTEPEAISAQKQLQEEQAKVARQRGASSSFAPPAFLARGHSVSQPREADLPEESPTPAPPAEKPPEQLPKAAPPLARLQAILQSASDIAARTEDETLRTALMTTALKVLAGEAEKMITTLESAS
jgi:ProP effector